MSNYLVAHPGQAQTILNYMANVNLKLLLVAHLDFVEGNMIDNLASRKQEKIVFPGIKSIKNYNFCIFIQRKAFDTIASAKCML